MTLCRAPRANHLRSARLRRQGERVAGDLQGTGFLLANEAIRGRLTLLQWILCRSHWGNHATSNWDAEQLATRLPGRFDCVLVDAPCSGQSMVSAKKQSWSAFSEVQIAHSAARQSRIIDYASRLVAPGGRLVYATCTFSVAENEHIIERFLEQHGDWAPDPMPELDRWVSPRLAGCYRLWSHRDLCDGGFAAALRRSSTDSISADSPPARTVNRPKSWEPWQGQLSQVEFLHCDAALLETYSAYHRRGQVHLFHRLAGENIPPLTVAGWPLFEHHPSGRLEPLYGSAVVQQTGLTAARRLQLDSELAIQFFSGDSLPLTMVPYPAAGWCRVDWQDRPLSWGKIAGGTLKNHLPKPLRQLHLNISD